MRKLKLQMQLSLNGYVGGPNGELSWMVWDWDDELKKYVTELTDSVGTILLGRKMTDGFISHWMNVTRNPNDPDYESARKFIDYPKVVFTRTLQESQWDNTTLAKGNLKYEIARLKGQDGKDAIAYGGANFVSSLIRENLIDDYYLFVNPVAISKGLTIFGNLEDKFTLNLTDVRKFDCGIVLMRYQSTGQAR